MRTLKSLMIGVAIAGSLGAIASTAWAGCGDGATAQAAAWTPAANGTRNPLLVRVALPAATSPTIVGLWQFTFLGTNGARVDFGYQEWHSDGTEIMNSGGRAPATENFCLGAWEQTGSLTYKLNHFALSYDASSGKLNARVNIQENVTIAANGQTFKGPFTLSVYAPGSHTLLQQISGTVTGSRITPSTAL